MKRHNVNGSIYKYLDAIGVLETGTEEDIEVARKKYWTEYKRQWKKEMKKSRKSFEIFLTLKEANIITQEAKKNHTSTTNYIKQSALTNRGGIVDHVVIGEFRELLFLHHSALETLIENNMNAPEIDFTTFEEILNMEEQILEFLVSLKRQK